MNINKAKETEQKSSLLILIIDQFLQIKKNTCRKEMNDRFLWFYNGFLFHLSIFIFLEWL